MFYYLKTALRKVDDSQRQTRQQPKLRSSAETRAQWSFSLLSWMEVQGCKIDFLEKLNLSGYMHNTKVRVRKY